MIYQQFFVTLHGSIRLPSWKNILLFLLFSKSVYLFIHIYFVPFISSSVANCCTFKWLQFEEQEKITRGQVRWIWWLMHDYGVISDHKFKQIWGFSLHCLTHDSKIRFFVECTTIWQTSPHYYNRRKQCLGFDFDVIHIPGFKILLGKSGLLLMSFSEDVDGTMIVRSCFTIVFLKLATRLFSKNKLI